MLTLLLPLFLAAGFEAERVLAVVNGVPVLASDADLAQAGALIPREAGESDSAYRRATVDALVQLELRWQDLEAASLVSKVTVDFDAAWTATVNRAGGAGALAERLASIGLPESALRALVRRAAVVEAYVATRFEPFVRPSPAEVEKAWQAEFAPKLKAAGKPVPELSAVRSELEALLRERKLADEVDGWTAELAKRAEIVRYLGPEGAGGTVPAAGQTPTPNGSALPPW